MSKAEDKALEVYPKMSRITEHHGVISADYESHYLGDANEEKREGFIEGYHQAEKDIKEELSKLFQEFMLDCINDDTETHILHFVDVFNNKLKMIGNE